MTASKALKFATATIAIVLLLGATVISQLTVALTNADLIKTPASPNLLIPIVRFGVNAVGDAPPSWWWRQSGTCASNSMVNDIGSCNDASDGNSFIAITPIGYDVRQWGAACDGASNDASALNAAEAYFNLIGGGAVQLPYGKTCAFSTSLQLLSNVKLDLNKGTLKWTGANAGPVFSTSGSVATNDYTVTNGTVNVSGSFTGSVFALNSGLRMVIRDIVVTGGGGSGIVLDLSATISPALPGNNHGFGEYNNITAYGDFGTCIRMTGTNFGASQVVVTDNRFAGIKCFVVEHFGVDFEAWADTNIFYYTFIHVSGSNGVGVVFNNSAPTTNVGVYANTFYNLGIDTGAPAGLNRTGVVINFSYNSSIYDLDQYPHAEAGQFVNNGIANSNTSCIGTATPCPYDIFMTIPDAGSFFRTWYPGSNSLWGQDFVIAGKHISNSNTISVGSASGIGSSGTITTLAGGSASHFQVQLSPAGAAPAPAAAGQFTITFPADNPPTGGGHTCTANPQNGSGSWNAIAPVSMIFAGIDALHTAMIWVTNSALTAGVTYVINVSCISS